MLPSSSRGLFRPISFGQLKRTPCLTGYENLARSRSLFSLRSARILEQKRDCSQSTQLSEAWLFGMVIHFPYHVNDCFWSRDRPYAPFISGNAALDQARFLKSLFKKHSFVPVAWWLTGNVNFKIHLINDWFFKTQTVFSQWAIPFNICTPPPTRG